MSNFLKFYTFLWETVWMNNQEVDFLLNETDFKWVLHKVNVTLAKILPIRRKTLPNQP